jgi:hypothetical protein
MSLGISIEQPNGVVCSYWLVSAIRIDLLANTMFVDLSGYVDSTYYPNMTPVTAVTIQANINIKSYMNENGTLNTIYTTIAENNATFLNANVISDGN